MNIDLNPDALDEITRENLKIVLRDFNADLKKDKPMIFTTDPKEDKKIIRQHIKAFEMTLNYFSVCG